jgi:MFS family permease
MSIFPYVYYMIESFHMTDDDRKISLYAGMVTSAFAFAEFSSGMFWGRASDRFGRKPILLTGLAGTGISMIVFGFAPNLPVALIARALGGLLNGNIGVLQSTVAEVVTVEAHQARAYSIMPVVWCVGSIAGSAIGGILADPVRNYGWSEGSIWAKYPFLLPNVFCTAIVILGMIVGILFLEETHEDKKHERDRGVEAGKWILGLFGKSSAPQLSSRKRDYAEETFILMHEDIDCPPDYRSTASSPELSPSAAPVGLPPPAYQSIEGSPRNSMTIQRVDPEALAHEAEIAKRNASLSNAFTKQVNLIIVSYGILA